VEHSLYIFPQDSIVRMHCKALASDPRFEWFIFVLILLSCAFLAIDTPNRNHRLPNVDEVLLVADPVLLTIFVLEFAIKVVGMGFCGKPTAFMADPMNRFDFLILNLSALTIFFKELGGIGRVFRVARCLRPLRMVSRSKNLKVVLISTINVIPECANAMFFYMFMTFLFATVGLSLFMGEFEYCNMAHATGRDTCIGTFMADVDTGAYLVPAVWTLPNKNFDNIGVSVVGLLEVSSTELWVECMFSGMDVTGVDMQPVKNSEGINALFFVFFLIVTKLVLFSLLVGIIIDQFNTTSGNGMLTEKQRNFKLITQAIFTEPKPQKLIVPTKETNIVAYVCYRMVSWQYWDSMVLGLIMINGIMLAAPFYGMPEGYATVIHTTIHSISFLFLVELFTRIFAFGHRQFFDSTWNLFDCFVVSTMTTASIVAVGFKYEGLSAIGALRLLQLARLPHRAAQSLRTIIVTLAQSVAPLSSVLAIITLVFFIYAVIGMTFWGNVRHDDQLSIAFNFESFDLAMATLLMMITGENWTAIMHACAVEFPKCTPYDQNLPDGTVLANDCGDRMVAYMYFISFYFIGHLFLLALFVAVISDCFQTCNAMRSFGIEQVVFDDFGKLWLDRTEKTDFKFLMTHQIRPFLLELGLPLGGNSVTKLHEVHRQVTYMLGEEVTLQDGRTGIGVGYRKFLWLLVMESGDLDQIPFAERTIRVDELERMKALAMMRRFAATWRGNRVKAAFDAHKKEALNPTGGSNLDAFWLALHGAGKLEAAQRAQKMKAGAQSSEESDEESDEDEEDVGEEGESDEDVKGDKEEDSDPEFPEELGFLDNNRGRHESDEGSSHSDSVKKEQDDSKTKKIDSNDPLGRRGQRQARVLGRGGK